MKCNSKIYYLRNNKDNLSFLISELGHSPFYSEYDQFLEINMDYKNWKTVSFLILTPGFPPIIPRNEISIMLRKDKINRIKEKNENR